MRQRFPPFAQALPLRSHPERADRLENVRQTSDRGQKTVFQIPPICPDRTRLIFARTHTAADAANLGSDQILPASGPSSPVTRHFPLAVDEVGKLPTPFYPRDPDSIAVIIERRVGKLRRRDHEIAFFDESLR